MPTLVAEDLTSSEFEALKNKSGKVVGPTLEWQDVSFHVGDKPILSNVSGAIAGGSVCAILGPSGAGKSSLLNVLAGRSASRGPVKVSAYMSVDGKAVNPVTFRRNVAYVMQDDALVATATPREALAFSAALRLKDMPLESRTALVDTMLNDLGLSGCADVMIGGEMIKGISGGQRKRTSVGVELVTKPSLVFLDEPTSGLDSDSAENCVRLLRTIAQRGTTVACTIHQPSSEVFDLFDSVMLLKDGRIMWQGPTPSVVDGFGARGYPSPAHHNPADFIMKVASQYSVEKLQGDGFFAADAPSMARSNSGNKLVLLDTPAAGGTSPSKARQTGAALEGDSLQPILASFSKQLYELLTRESQALVRDKAALIGRFGITIFLNLLFGLIFEGAGSRDSAEPDALPSHFGALVMVTIGSMFGTAQPVMLGFPLERPVFLREYTTGTYSVLAYFLAKGLVELPLAFLQNLVAYILVYPLLGLQGNFIMLVGAAWALGIASSSVAVVLGCSVPDVKAVAELAPAVFVPQMLFAGFFVRISQIPTYLRWAQYLCALKYCLNLIMLIEFNDCGSNSASPEIADMACDNLLEQNDVVKEDWGLYLIVLAALFFSFRILGAWVLTEKAKVFF